MEIKVGNIFCIKDVGVWFSKGNKHSLFLKNDKILIIEYKEEDIFFIHLKCFHFEKGIITFAVREARFEKYFRKIC